MVLSSINWYLYSAQLYKENVDWLQSECRSAWNPVIMYSAETKDIQQGD